MFEGCTGLTTIPSDYLPTLAQGVETGSRLPPSCFEGMFKGCTNLKKIPVLPYPVLGDYCYKAMFEGCSSLVIPPTLPATTFIEYGGTIANGCYESMFKDCISLATAPALPITEVGDYSYSDDGVCEVTMELRLFGGRGSLSEAAFLPYKNKQKISFPAPVDKNALKQLAAASKTYTGLVVDCSGLNINCVMSPVILNEQGTTIYGYQNLDYDKIIVRGMVSYAEEIGDQISQARAGENPLVIKALSLDEFQANPKVSVADADKILAANQHDKFLDNCAVVFVK